LVLAILLLAGCSPKVIPSPESLAVPKPSESATLPAGRNIDEGSRQYVTIYLIQGEYLLPVTLYREKSNRTAAQEVLDALLEWNYPEWAVSPLPLTTEVRSVTVSDETVIVDFAANSLYGLEGGSLGESLLLQSLVLSLTEKEGIDEVLVYLDGDVAAAAFGHLDTSAPLRRPEFFNLEDSDSEGSSSVRLWFIDPQGMFLIPVTRHVSEKKPDCRTVLLELLSGPKDDSMLLSSLPQGAELLDVFMDGTTCVVDFNSAFVSNHSGGTTGERQTLEAIVLSLTELPGVDGVQLLVNGEPGDALLGSIATDKPIGRGYPNIFE
jgi:germination protein M